MNMRKTWNTVMMCGLVGWAASVSAADLQVSATAPEKLNVAKGFKVELLYNVPKAEQGSWVSMAVDPKGRLVVSDQYGKLYRVTLPPVGTTAGIKVDPLDLQVGYAHGLLCAFDSLYVMVNEDKFQGRGLYRVRDTNGDDQYDEVKLLRKLDGGGEHGPHAILLNPDGKGLTIVAGNMTKLPDYDSTLVPPIWGEDHLIKRMWDGNGFMKGVLGPGGWIAETDPEGKTWKIRAVGFRNQFDAAYNRVGELFTYDADMEWDLNTPWYRPTRVNLVNSGAEFGWRSGAGKWPAYYPDSLGEVVNIGPGSPTGVVFGYGAKFPAKYQNALFIADWSYGKLYAVHLKSQGSGYTGAAEEFVTGSPLPLTDVLVHPRDGSLYFAIGGRKTQSGLYRVSYVGTESTAPAKVDTVGAKERALRHKLESFHGRKDPAAVKTVWPHLKSEDRYLRYAARVALEWQDVKEWQDRALAEKNPTAAIQALVALARVSGRDVPHRKPADPQPEAGLQGKILASLDRLDWGKLNDGQRLELIRAYALGFTRLGAPDESTRQRMIAKFDALFPAADRRLNAELAPMLVYLEAPSAATKLVKLIQTAPTQEEQLDYGRALRVLKTGWTLDLRKEYFGWFLKAANFRGGASLAGFMRDMKADAVANLSETEVASLKPILDAKPQVKKPMELLGSRTLVKNWTFAELAGALDSGLKGGRDFNRGRAAFGTVACAACHRFDQEGGAVGPDLTGVSGRFSPRDLLESIMDPSKEVSDQYASIVVHKKDGDSLSGRVANLNDDTLMIAENMLDPGNLTNVRRKDIESITTSKVSPMPEGLLNSLTRDEILDLMAYLLSKGGRRNAMFR